MARKKVMHAKTVKGAVTKTVVKPKPVKLPKSKAPKKAAAAPALPEPLVDALALRKKIRAAETAVDFAKEALKDRKDALSSLEEELARLLDDTADGQRRLFDVQGQPSKDAAAKQPKKPRAPKKPKTGGVALVLPEPTHPACADAVPPELNSEASVLKAEGDMAVDPSSGMVLRRGTLRAL